MNELAIEIEGLVHEFTRGERVLDELDLTVERGVVYGLVGRNGSGKTTTLRILMGLLTPSSGTARILGQSLANAPPLHRSRVTYVPQEPRLYPRWSLQALAELSASLYPNWDAVLALRLARNLELRVDVPIQALSGGQRRKAALLLALAARPEVILLDEPAAGLDPVARRSFLDILVEVVSDQPELTVLLSTHVLTDVERIAHRIGILDDGDLVLSHDIEALQERCRRVQVVFEGDHVPDDFEVPGTLRREVSGSVLQAISRNFGEAELEALRARPGVRVESFPLPLEDLVVAVLGPRALRDRREGMLT